MKFKNILAMALLAVGVVALSGCDEKSEDGRFQMVDLVSNGNASVSMMIDHYAHKYYFVNSNGGTPLEITAAQAGKYADQVATTYQEPTEHQSTAAPQPSQYQTPVIINNRNN
ncbi:hypothetical protein K3712_000535 [Escherichia coli]|nr:hypothetical protein [Escherichia coli]